MAIAITGTGSSSSSNSGAPPPAPVASGSSRLPDKLFLGAAASGGLGSALMECHADAYSFDGECPLSSGCA
eukprot:CAMPEP_0117860444 /NCGR_PEP_ID=MMETSP0950-20121206/3772_1 /TAXON_ID=44440 /ORGANISM="Chattonella subsalsa, Strain CCMP2191" /LENGTH=70 /DNA_ID=CAMNT_0005710589 /DNA_START=274 /DNA_END=487 /DNA_ORIENTATION=-